MKPRPCACGCGQLSQGKYVKAHRAAALFEERFWARIDKRGPDDCWLWTGSQNGVGYGELMSRDSSRKVLAHRIAYELAKGPLGEFLACHSCDVRLCCNANHIWPGTHVDNIKDAARKGRLNRGEKNGGAKLSRDDVLEIRRRFAALPRGKRGVLPGYVKSLSQEFGLIGPNSIGNIIRGVTWAWP